MLELGGSRIAARCLVPRLRQALAVGLVAGGVWACGSAQSSDSGSPGAGTGAGNDGFTINIELPAAVETRLTQLVHELAAIICQRSRNCCSTYGFRPLDDCTDAAGGAFILKLSRFAFESKVEDFDFAVDEKLAAACLDAARAVQNDCTFATEPVVYAWADPCEDALKFAMKGEPLPECANDQDCVTLQGPAHHCFNHACLPDFQAATGASCQTDIGATSYAVCAASDYCPSVSSPTCTPRGLPGGTCYSGNDTCVEGYSCTYSSDTSVSSCEPRRDAGQPCSVDWDCKEDVCACDPGSGCLKKVCFDFPHIGDPCTQTSDCRDASFVCGPKGICQPPQLAFCEPPPKP